MIRRPPRSPLFPYPPLFRSPVGGRVEEPAVARLPLGVDQRRVADRDLRADLAALPLVRPDRVPAEQEQVERRDRKSTRLNSSHANISYAVFCLKKKNNLDHSTDSLFKQIGCVGGERHSQSFVELSIKREDLARLDTHSEHLCFMSYRTFGHSRW